MSGLIHGVAGLFGGSSAKTDRNQTLNSYQNLNSLFNFGLNTAKGSVSAGNANQDAASGYFAKLASGNRPAMLQAVAPQTNAINQSADAARRQQSEMGTSRGGGVAGANQTADTDRMTQVNNALFGVQPEAAKEQADIGGRQVGQGLESQYLANSAAGANLNASIGSRMNSYAIHQDTANRVGDTIDAALGMFAPLKKFEAAHS